MKHRKAILPVDDHPVVRQALRDIIKLTDVPNGSPIICGEVGLN